MAAVGNTRTQMNSDDAPNAPPPLLLPRALDLTRADALHGALQECMGRDAPVRLEASAVETVSTACLQVLVAAAMSACGQGRSFAVLSPSDALRDAARDLGLGTILGMGAA